MEKITTIAEIKNCSKNDMPITFVNEGVEETYDAIGVFPKTQRWCLVEKNTLRVLCVNARNIEDKELFFGDYNGNFIEQKIIEFHQNKIEFHAQLIEISQKPF